MRIEAGITGELCNDALPWLEETSPFKIQRKTEIVLALLVSVVILIPCFWQRHIQAGDLASHVYNAWLAQLVETGKAPGVYTVWQGKNVLFGLMLLKLGQTFGFGVGGKNPVSPVVLGVFSGLVPVRGV